jgi:dipeptidyl aminopeptidase/acylaminoacyl peptidase
MTTSTRIERELPGILTDLAAGPIPDYIDDVLSQTGRKRQRAAWTYPERWFPMADIAARPVSAPGLPWRTIGVGLLVIGLVVAAALAYVGAHQTKLPPPFGLARNGLVAYSQDGDIYTADSVTGAAKAIVADGADDVQPLWTRDGTRLLFEQKVQGEAGRGYVELVNADGGGLRRITPEPMTDLRWYELAPDGKSVLILSNIDGAQRISVANADGTGVRPLDTGSAVQEVEFLPPDGAQLLYVSFGGVYRMNLDGTGQTTIVKPVSLFNHEDEVFMMGIAVPSPDGTSIAYSSIEGLKVRVHVVNADGTGDRVVGHDPTAWGEWSPLWSPDGSRLLLDRVIGPAGDWSVPAKPEIVTIDGSAPDVTALALPEGASDEYRVWAPDGRTILVRPAGEPTAPNRQVRWDATTGASIATPWSATSYPAMQRLAP